MNWVTAAGTGFGLGLAYFGGLWLSIRAIRSGAPSPIRLTVGRLARFALAGITFYALLQTGGISAVVAGLVGLLAARWQLFCALGGEGDGQ
jgi:hypothetical protein